jgi:predicted ferric reductase
MQKLKGTSFPLLIIVIILGVVLFKEFNFDTLRFRHAPMALVYMFGLGLALYFIFRGRKKTERTG